MSVKNLALIALMFGTMPAAVVASHIDGKWVSETQVGDADGKTYAHTSTFTLKSEGTTLTGSVVQVSEAPWMKRLTGRSFDISDGRIEGDKFHFKVTVETKTGEKTAIYEGTFEGDELKGNVKYRGIGITQTFHAKRSN